MSNNNGGDAVLWGILGLAQSATYVMSAVRWFGTNHNTFWYGAKELIWALVPVANFGYVWDWWVGAFMFVLALLQR